MNFDSCCTTEAPLLFVLKKPSFFGISKSYALQRYYANFLLRNRQFHNSKLCKLAASCGVFYPKLGIKDSLQCRIASCAGSYPILQVIVEERRLYDFNFEICFRSHPIQPLVPQQHQALITRSNNNIF